jgi:hypothetical protein
MLIISYGVVIGASCACTMLYIVRTIVYMVGGKATIKHGAASVCGSVYQSHAI